MRFAVAVFPGSNCDIDAHRAMGDVLGQKVEYVWHRETALSGFDGIILPGGFSYGDYLRPGAIARFSPLMASVIRFARNGGIVIGICNGFQLLTEAGLLPGALLRNRGLTFICDTVHVRVEHAGTAFTGRCSPGQVLHLPIAMGTATTLWTPLPLRRWSRRARCSCGTAPPRGPQMMRTIPTARARALRGLSTNRAMWPA